jgi:hypothetical protein
MLYINETPEGFKSTANRDIYSEDVEQVELTTESIMASVCKVHDAFKEHGIYEAIKNSDLYTHGSGTNDKDSGIKRQ